MTGPRSTAGSASMQLVRGLVGACHPAPTLAVTTVGTLLSVGVGLDADRVALVAVAVLTGQLSIGWSNDRIDAARDRATGRSDKPTAEGSISVNAVGTAAALALASTLALSALLGLRAGGAALTLVAAGWAYNLGLKASVWSGAAYVVGFGALPAVPYLARAGQGLPPWWAPVAGALLGFAAHFANVLPDLADDEATGVRGLPQRLGRRAGTLVMAASLAAASVVLGFGPGNVSGMFAVGVSAAGVAAAVAAATAAERRPDSALAFRLTLLIALLDVGLLVTVGLRS